MSNRTEWFPESVNPVHEGVYERKYPWGNNYAYFNGQDWGVAEDTPQGADLWRHMLSDMVCKWRGLAKEPK